MQFIDDIESLEALYDAPKEMTLKKVTAYLTPLYRAWIAQSRFCVVSTVGPEGTDASPRGDEGPVAIELDAQTLALPDWRGNNRLDTLRNIVRDGRVSLMFFVPGSNNVIRINGTARLTVDADLRARFEKSGAMPKTVIVVRIEEVYSQCARALLRSELWTAGDQSAGLPSVGQIMAEITKGALGGTDYDATWSAQAVKTLW